MLAGCTLRQEDISLFIINPATDRPIDEKTLRKHFARELEIGAVKADLGVVRALHEAACGKGPQAVTAAIWWTKARLGWSEKVQQEVSTNAGVLVAPAAASTEEWIAKAAERNAQAKEPGGLRTASLGRARGLPA